MFPALLVAAIGGAAWALTEGASGGAVIGIVSVSCILAVVTAERLLPYRRNWNRSQGDLAVDAAYLPITAGVNAAIEPAVAFVGAAIGAALSAALGIGLWPGHWPLLGQVALACVVAELFDYWAHRVMHENEWLWRFHATHHSAPRLYWLNATRAHPCEMLFRGTVGMLPMSILGAGEPIFIMLAVVNVSVGLFQHANIDFRLGPLSWIFSVGELHRWHHSTVIGEANRNYGNNFIFWDAVFGTRFLPGDRHCPNALGIGGLGAFPSTLAGQLAAPFRWSRINGAVASAAPRVRQE
jgi:sterol desaturase/sphingolipid hydroxylase (fatty acid hydroxylase superfamily)